MNQLFLSPSCGSGRVEALSEALASVRRQGVRGENLLKDGDNLIQRHRNLEARLQQQTDAQDASDQQCEKLSSQTEETRTWISQMLQPLTDGHGHAEEMKQRAQVSEASTAPKCDERIKDSGLTRVKTRTK